MAVTRLSKFTASGHSVAAEINSRLRDDSAAAAAAVAAFSAVSGHHTTDGHDLYEITVRHAPGVAILVSIEPAVA